MLLFLHSPYTLESDAVHTGYHICSEYCGIINVLKCRLIMRGSAGVRDEWKLIRQARRYGS